VNLTEDVGDEKWCRIGTLTGEVLGSTYPSEVKCNEDATGATESCKLCSQTWCINGMPNIKYDSKEKCETSAGSSLTCELCTPPTSNNTNLCTAGGDPGRYPGDSQCKQYFDIIDASGTANKSLAKSIMVMETGCKPQSVSGAGACGIMQMKPSTADSYSSSCGGPATPDCGYLKNNPEKAICMGIKYLDNSVARLGLHNAIASYNAGLGPSAMGPSVDCTGETSCSGGAIKKWECPYSNPEHTAPDTGFEETRNYVKGTMYYMQKF
jgi:hypothetical protein